MPKSLSEGAESVPTDTNNDDWLTSLVNEFPEEKYPREDSPEESVSKTEGEVTLTPEEQLEAEYFAEEAAKQGKPGGGGRKPGSGATKSQKISAAQQIEALKERRGEEALAQIAEDLSTDEFAETVKNNQNLERYAVWVLACAQSREIVYSSDDRLADFTKKPFRKSSGAGGQNVNKRETAIKLTHKLSGISAESYKHRSQSENSSEALEIAEKQLLKHVEAWEQVLSGVPPKERLEELMKQVRKASEDVESTKSNAG